MHQGPGCIDYAKRYLILLSLVVAAVLVLYLLWKASDAIILVFAGILLSQLILAMTNRIKRWTQLPHPAAVGVVVCLLLGILVLGIWGMGPSVADQMQHMIDQVASTVEGLQERLGQSSLGRRFLRQASGVADLSKVGQFISRTVSLFSTILGGLVALVTVLFVGLYGALQPDLYVSGILRLVPRARRLRAKEVIETLSVALTRWFVGRLMAMAIVGILTWLGLFLLDIPLAVALAVTAALLDFVPNFGPILAALPAVLLALSAGPGKVAFVVGLYFLIQQLENVLVTPVIQRRAVSMPPILLIGAQLVLGLVLGLPGLIFATPLTVTGLVLVRMLYVEDVLGERTSSEVHDT